MTQRTSPFGRAIIEAFEGCERSDGRGGYVMYHDSVGVPTQGYGHTNLGNMPSETSPPTSGGMSAGVTLTQSQFDALVSFDFNTGSLGRSSIPAKLRANDLASACATLAEYNHAGGRVLDGLTRRRACEVALMNGNVTLAARLAGIAPTAVSQGVPTPPPVVPPPPPPATVVPKFVPPPSLSPIQRLKKDLNL